MIKKQHFIKVKRTVEYYTLIPEDESPKTILFALHGYAQLPEYFIERFKVLAQKGIVVVAPSGLSLFYNAGSSGRVGASWMTKHNRKNEISDYINYLEDLHEQVRMQFPTVSSASVIGFSQGTATAARWVSQSASQFNNLILWAGGLPQDMEDHILLNTAKTTSLYFSFGNKDPLISNEKIDQQIKSVEAKDIPFKLIKFEGGHEIPEKALTQLTKVLI